MPMIENTTVRESFGGLCRYGFSLSAAGASSGYPFSTSQTRQLAAGTGAQEYLPPKGKSPAGSSYITSGTELILSVESPRRGCENQWLLRGE